MLSGPRPNAWKAPRALAGALGLYPSGGGRYNGLSSILALSALLSPNQLTDSLCNRLRTIPALYLGIRPIDRPRVLLPTTIIAGHTKV
jgi:hypothetical protein